MYPYSDLIKVKKPGQYTGGELNSIVKNTENKLRFLLAFPDLYEIGMSYTGLHILYELINRQENIFAERVFAPWIDFEKILREKKLPLLSLETKTPMNKFDVVGFTFQYELTYTNFLNMLDLSGIPLRSKERTDFPLIMAGGPCVSNPEPIAPFVDFFYIGEAETYLIEILNKIQTLKQSGKNRKQILEQLAEYEFIYVPEFSKYRQTEFFLIPEYPKKVKRTFPLNFEQRDFPEKAVQPNVQIVYDRVTLEISRGCDEGCRFCQAGYIYRPQRERKPEDLITQADTLLKNTGQDEISLTSLSAANYPGIELLIETLMKKYSDERISLSLPSIRADKFKDEFAISIKEGRKTGFTIAPEAGTERLRKIINKNLKEEDIFWSAKTAFENGWDHIKFYFMIGLPFEEYEDLEGIVKICEKSLEFAKRGHVILSASTFVPKPHTPFQWIGQITYHETVNRQEYIKSLVKTRRIRYKFHDPAMSVLEGIISRGDVLVADVIEKAFKMGVRFDGWSDTFDFSIWEKAIKKSGINIERYYIDLPEDTEFPWDFIDIGVRKKFLLQELKRAIEGKNTEMCVDVKSCNACGTCSGKYLKERFEKRIEFYNKLKQAVSIENNRTKTEKEEERYHYLFIFNKKNEMKFISHLDLIRIIQRGLRISKLPIAFTKGFSPKPILTFSPALELGIEGENEMFIVEMKEKVDINQAIFKINRGLPEGIRVKEGKIVPFEKRKFLSGKCKLYYLIESKDNLEINRDWQKLKTKKKTKRGFKEIEVKNYVKKVTEIEKGKYIIESEFSPDKGSLKITEIVPLIFKNTNLDNAIIKRQKIEYGEL
ncbi:conserved hypothetical protein [Thermotomaculum hydrothermale]|uniref:Radical SAM core domain-containing protein n=2 Tax=Thermotomaculum hydrothermale TaxID=981385 RepID=A0A7R6PP52_9BACT|nr:conserved hypothetical protein [Thermotomaculum hydrothermale]